MSLLGLMSCAFIWVIAINWMLQTYNSNKTKPLIDHATHAASLDFVPSEAALGRLVWDTTAGTNDFYKYLRMNLKLDSSNNPVAGSHLMQAPVVHDFEFVSNPTYPYVLNRSLIVYAGSTNETIRNVNVTIYGPSIVAIVEVRQNLIGLGRSEPIVLSSVASVRFR
jgi:hypothetical protein